MSFHLRILFVVARHSSAAISAWRRCSTELQRLIARGVKQFKFVDRTFNLNLNVSRALLQFFLDRYEPGMFFHFEMVPDRLPEALRNVIAKFPHGVVAIRSGHSNVQ